MPDSGTDFWAAATDPNSDVQPPPVEFATQVATLAGDETPFRQGELPLWSRLTRPAKRVTWRSRLLAALGWCVTIGLLAIAVLRITFHDEAVLLTWLNAFTLYLYLPAYVVLAFAAWTRRYALGLTSAAVIACHLTWIAPDFLPARSYSSSSGTASAASPPVRIFYANTHGGYNRDVESVLGEALADDPDVIILSELDPVWIRQLLPQQAALLKAYPYGTDLKHRNSGDMCIFSRLPVRRMEQIHYQWRCSLVVDVSAGDQWLRVVAVHSPRPTFQVRDSYYEFWDQLEPIVGRPQGPLVLIGDCNATQHSRIYEQLGADGLRSAHEDRGRGYATTWPNGFLPVPPIRIDQAFLSPDVECTSVREGIGAKSDHKPLILDVRVHGDPSSDPAR